MLRSLLLKLPVKWEEGMGFFGCSISNSHFLMRFVNDTNACCVFGPANACLSMCFQMCFQMMKIVLKSSKRTVFFICKKDPRKNHLVTG